MIGRTLADYRNVDAIDKLFDSGSVSESEVVEQYLSSLRRADLAKESAQVSESMGQVPVQAIKIALLHGGLLSRSLIRSDPQPDFVTNSLLHSRFG
jgi:hypothetical protein